MEVKLTDGIKVGGNNPCFVIAEIGQNHQGDIEIAKELIRAVKDAGADCAKFQKTCIEEKFTKAYLERPYNNVNSWGKTYGEHKKHLEFSEVQFKELSDYAKEIGILMTASAMDMVSVDFLVNLKVPFIKIGSGDSNNLPLIRYAASKKVPLIISTGMIDKSTVDSIYNAVLAEHKEFCLLHCVSAYPVAYKDCNLNVLQEYRQLYNVPVGYSGHEIGNAVSLSAVAIGAKVLERHVTLDKCMKGTDHVCSLTPKELKQLIQDIRIVEAALGSSVKRVVASENACMEKLQKSLVVRRAKKKGEILCPDDVTVKVSYPKGLDALLFDDVVDKRLTCDKMEDEPLFPGDII